VSTGGQSGRPASVERQLELLQELGLILEGLRREILARERAWQGQAARWNQTAKRR
jgi:hypothetical protein